MKLFRALIVSVLFGGGTLLATPLPHPQTNLPKLELKLGKKTLTIPMAVTPEQRAIGLMYRTSLEVNEGMLFVFDFPQQVAFWMKNTAIPLSVAYISPSGMILEIHDMQPFSEDLMQSIFTSVLYALEMPKGWFERNDIHPGMTVDGLPAFHKKSNSDS